jgi:hypothetical protein
MPKAVPAVEVTAKSPLLAMLSGLLPVNAFT